jgi:hypothetical protein
MEKPRLSFWQIWNMSFGFLGIQFGWGLQMANMSAIYEYLGARPDQIPILWLAAPLTGLIIQPIIGHMSDRTDCTASKFRSASEERAAPPSQAQPAALLSLHVWISSPRLPYHTQARGRIRGRCQRPRFCRLQAVSPPSSFQLTGTTLSKRGWALRRGLWRFSLPAPRGTGSARSSLTAPIPQKAKAPSARPLRQ